MRRHLVVAAASFALGGCVPSPDPCLDAAAKTVDFRFVGSDAATTDAGSSD